MSRIFRRVQTSPVCAMTVTVGLMVVNETTLALLVRAGNMPWALGSWPLWRVSLLIAAGIVLAQYFLRNNKDRWGIAKVLVIAWLLILAWYGAFTFWYWQIPVIDMRDLCVPPLLGMIMALLVAYENCV
ncbi:hypothetical protein SC171_16540 [Pantoea cypripedii]|uniref:hypothetical protein n=1 Tax=Pantoea cypripedii TaxID=55209 RepID=UPI002FC96316